MKLNKLIIAIGITSLLASCGGNQNSNGKKFNPSEKQSSMSDAERAEAIAAKKAALGFDLDSLLTFDGVKFSVLPPKSSNDFPAKAAEKLYNKIIAIAGQNGVGGIATNPVLGLATSIDVLEHEMTSTAPQKAVIKYEVTLYCGNFITNEIYASASTTVTGVGSDFGQAGSSAINELKSTPAFAEMFRKASTNAIKWYDNVGNLTMVIDKAVSEQNYALAMAFLSSVPVQATAGHKYAETKNTEVCNLFFQSKANQLMSQMQSAIAESPEIYNPKAGALFSLIPHNSKVYPEALKAFEAYTKKLDMDRRDLIDRERAVEDRKAANAQMLAMEELQVQKVKAPLEMQATLAQIEADAKIGVAQATADGNVRVAQAEAEGKKNANTGGFLGLGKLWDNSFSIVNKLFFDEEDD